MLGAHFPASSSDRQKLEDKYPRNLAQRGDKCPRGKGGAGAWMPPADPTSTL